MPPGSIRHRSVPPYSLNASAKYRTVSSRLRSRSICATTSYYGINKKLEEPGNEEKLAIALEMFDLMSTPEGQSMFTDGAEGRYPAMRKADGELHAPLLSDYRNVVDRNNLVELAAYTAPLLLGGEALGGYIAGTVSAEEALQACDEAMKSNKSETQIYELTAYRYQPLSSPSPLARNGAWPKSKSKSVVFTLLATP